MGVVMKTQNYYRIPDDIQCDCSIIDQYLIVNCTGVYTLNQPFSTKNARGRQDYYLMYLHRGSLKIEIDGRDMQLNAGDIAIYPANQPYGYIKIDQSEMVYYWAHFSGYGVQECLHKLGLYSGIVCSPGKSESITVCFHRLFQCFYTRESYFEQSAAARMIDVLVCIARHMDKQQQGSTSMKKIERSLEYLYHNYCDDIRLKQLAEMEHLSPSRYSAVFKQCMGLSPQGFIISLRMENAADLLHRTDLSIKQVAQAVGYVDPLYFSSLFKQKMGISPSGYQERQK